MENKKDDKRTNNDDSASSLAGHEQQLGYVQQSLDVLLFVSSLLREGALSAEVVHGPAPRSGGRHVPSVCLLH